MGRYTEITILPEREQNMLSVNFHTGKIDAVLTVFNFEDNGFIVSYIPSLMLSAYGETVKEAHDMLLHTVINDFFDTIINMKEAAMFAELSKLGWRCGPLNETRTYKNQAYIDKEGILRNFDLPQDTPIEQQILTV